jgi:hypothetical protein
MSAPRETFERQGYALVKGMLNKETAKFLYDYLVLTARVGQLEGRQGGDNQVPDSLNAAHGDGVFEALLWNLHGKMQLNTGLELLPTYSYRRLYCNGNVLRKHKDRPSCEVSVTIKLSDSGGYNWPIWMEGNPYELEDGDAVIYRGCDLEHWRDKCDAPDGYTLGQAFLHYVDKNGPYGDYAYDQNPRRAAAFQGLSS